MSMSESTLTALRLAYAHPHIPRFLELELNDVATDESGCRSVVQLVTNGSFLTSEAIRFCCSGSGGSEGSEGSRESSSKNDKISIHRPILVTDTPESIGMEIRIGKDRRPGRGRRKRKRRSDCDSSSGISNTCRIVREVASIVEPSTQVSVIDVATQKELDGDEEWTFGQLCDYFEDEERLMSVERRARYQRLLQAQLETHQQQGMGGKVKHSTKGKDNLHNHNQTLGTENLASSQRPRRKASLRQYDFPQSLGDQDTFADLHQPTNSFDILGPLLSISTMQVLNQVSYEFSGTPLAPRFKSPTFVRELDWIDQAWPSKEPSKGQDSPNATSLYPVIQYYCITSAAGAYMDFHIDFGGTTVWYHVISGEKQFCLIEPTPQILELYEQWLCSPDQSTTFFPDQLQQQTQQQEKDDNNNINKTPLSNTTTNSNHNTFRKSIVRITLKENQTMIIPSGWIHCVYTPVDAVVVGGNFLHGLDIRMQLAVNQMEVRRGVLEKYQCPYFAISNIYAASFYYHKLLSREVCSRELDELPYLINAFEEWYQQQQQQQELDQAEKDMEVNNDSNDNIDQNDNNLNKEYDGVTHRSNDSTHDNNIMISLLDVDHDPMMILDRNPTSHTIKAATASTTEELNSTIPTIEGVIQDVVQKYNCLNAEEFIQKFRTELGIVINEGIYNISSIATTKSLEKKNIVGDTSFVTSSRTSPHVSGITLIQEDFEVPIIATVSSNSDGKDCRENHSQKASPGIDKLSIQVKTIDKDCMDHRYCTKTDYSSDLATTNTISTTKKLPYRCPKLKWHNISPLNDQSISTLHSSISAPSIHKVNHITRDPLVSSVSLATTTYSNISTLVKSLSKNVSGQQKERPTITLKPQTLQQIQSLKYSATKNSTETTEVYLDSTISDTSVKNSVEHVLIQNCIETLTATPKAICHKNIQQKYHLGLSLESNAFDTQDHDSFSPDITNSCNTLASIQVVSSEKSSKRIKATSQQSRRRHRIQSKCLSVLEHGMDNDPILGMDKQACSTNEQEKDDKLNNPNTRQLRSNEKKLKQMPLLDPITSELTQTLGNITLSKDLIPQKRQKYYKKVNMTMQQEQRRRRPLRQVQQQIPLLCKNSLNRRDTKILTTTNTTYIRQQKKQK